MAPKRKAAAPATEQAEPATEQANKFKKTVDDSASEILCPITQELPIDPVTAEDGRVYERSAIEEWLEKNEKSPHTNEPMGKKLLPALQAKNMIAALVKSGALSADKCVSWTQKLEQEKKVEELRQRAEAGEVRAMTQLAFKYKSGDGVKKDVAGYFQWSKRAADLNDAAGMSMVAVCHLHANGTTKNEPAGLIEIGQAAGLGSEHACYVLANAYRVGRYGLDKDVSQVARWAAKMQRARHNGLCDTSEENRVLIARYLAESQ